MNQKKCISIAMFLFIILLAFQITAKEEKLKPAEWKQIKKSHGIKVFSRPRVESKYSELLAHGTAKVPFEEGLEFVKDSDCYFEWYGMCRELYVIKKISENEFLMYFVLEMPMVTDRDVVVRVTRDWNLEKKSGRVTLVSVESDYKKDSGLVRMPKLDGGFEFKETDPDLLFLSYHVHADLGGNVPAWAVNIAAKKHPYETALGLQKHVIKEKYYERAEKLYGKSFNRYQ